MGLLGGPEAAAEAVAATLVAHVNDAVATINAAYTDMTLPTFAAANIYALHRSLIPEYPAIVVGSVDGKELANGAPNWAEDDHRLDVAILCQSDDELVLDKQTLRYLWAVWRTLKVQQALDNSLSGLAGVDTPSYGRSEAYQVKQGSPLMMRVAGIEVIVHIVETVF
jgi:hypothetical protein